MDAAKPPLNSRRQAILEILVTDYIRTAMPVASQQIAARGDLSVSPATIRNDMAELEELGFISRPHTSAGGVPADLAYRFHVERSGGTARAPREFELLVRRSINVEDADFDSWARAAANVLARTIQNGAIATAPRVFQTRLKQLQLVSLGEFHALLVLVMQEARVRQHLIQFPTHVIQDQLTALALKLNTTMSGKTPQEIRATWDSQEHDALSDLVIAEAVQLMVQEEQDEPQRSYVDGLRHILGQPEFASGLRAREAAEVLEDTRVLRPVLNEGQEPGQVRVIIGEEHADQQLRPYSIVLAQYGVPGEATGVLCAIGPTRMDYSRSIATVRYLADFLTRLTAALEQKEPK
ncbi:MAG: heat-inducible transcription repressor HrcA [SAR202 cluster bacterium]|nr:heat-inducible transcription repressor HrcA [SAR202 cluster bacterium]